MWLKKTLVEDTLREVEIVRLDWDLVQAWNAERPEGTPRLFTGFYWVNGSRQAGPFNTKSAALRDAWYACVAHEAPPALNRQRGRLIRINKTKRKS
jgi:hypothetical protein